MNFQESLNHLTETELDDLIQRAASQRVRVSRETELDRLRKEIFGRIASSGYSLEDIFLGPGRYPEELIRKIVARASAVNEK